MQIGRRRVLSLLGAGGAAAAGLIPSTVTAAPQPIYISANAQPQGGYSLACFTVNGRRHYEFPLPGRGHGIALSTKSERAMIFARRPDRFAIAFNPQNGAQRAQISAPSGHHFYGHGVFSGDGNTLYATENEFASGEGRIGIYDAANGFSRVAAFSSYGIGPHEVCLSPDGAFLIVANGGIRTHPDAGREKLNIDTMEPSLAVINRLTGTLHAKYSLNNARLKRLSIRHIAVGANGTICAVMQDQAPDWQDTPLVAFCRLNGPGLLLSKAPRNIQTRMRGYTGSVAVDGSGLIAGVTAPHGNLVTFWDTRTGGYVSHTDFSDVCGIAATRSDGEFILTSGVDGAAAFNVRTGTRCAMKDDFAGSRFWDNHLLTTQIAA